MKNIDISSAIAIACVMCTTPERIIREYMRIFANKGEYWRVQANIGEYRRIFASIGEYSRVQANIGECAAPRLKGALWSPVLPFVYTSTKGTIPLRISPTTARTADILSGLPPTSIARKLCAECRVRSCIVISEVAVH